MKSDKSIIFIIITAFLLFITAIVSVFFGSTTLPAKAVIDYFIGIMPSDSSFYFIIHNLRLPRIILSIVAGGILAVSGLTYQTILKNPLAEPFLLGVSSGASFGVAVAVLLSEIFSTIAFPYFPFAFTGSLLTIVIIFIMSSTGKSALYNIIFIGLSVSFLFNAGLTLIFSLLGNRAQDIIHWLFGSLAKPLGYSTLIVLVIIYFVFILILMGFSGILDTLYLPEESIATSGINISAVRMFLFILTSLLTALIVSLCGVIGFVGLIVPHIVRRFTSGSHKMLIPACAISGGLLLIVSDLFARSLLVHISDFGRELPIGVVTSIIGAPFFMYLLSNRQEH